MESINPNLKHYQHHWEQIQLNTYQIITKQPLFQVAHLHPKISKLKDQKYKKNIHIKKQEPPHPSLPIPRSAKI